MLATKAALTFADVYGHALEFAELHGYRITPERFDFIDAATKTADPIGAACFTLLGRCPASIDEACRVIGWCQARMCGFIDGFHWTAELAGDFAEGTARDAYDRGFREGCNARRDFETFRPSIVPLPAA